MLIFPIILLNLFGGFIQVLAIDNIKIQDAPYTVTVETKSHKFLSTGAILGRYWALTPASVVASYAHTHHRIRVRSGSGKFLKNGGLHQVETVHISPVTDLNGAVALIKLVDPFKFSLNVFSVPLAQELVNQGEKLSRIGWMESARKGSQLNKIDVEQVHFMDCADSYKKFDVTIPISMSCTNRSYVKEHTGDLVIYHGILQGMYVNMGDKQNQELPFTYIDVTYHGSWIKETVDDKAN